MEKSVKFIRNTCLAVVGLLVIFIGLSSIMAVLKMISWEDVGYWSTKAAVVSAIVVVVSLVLSFISAALGEKS